MAAFDTSNFVLFDDFTKLDTAQWSSTDDGATGTNALAALAGGVMSVVTAAADNDYHLMATPAKCVLPTAAKGCVVIARVRLTEANTDDANWVIGLTDTLTTGFLANDGAGPPASYDGAVFFKVDGTMAVQFETSNGSAQVTTASLATFTSAVWYQLRFEFKDVNGTWGEVVPIVFNETTGVQTIGSAHRFLWASLGEMHLAYGVKAGGANAETLQIDYVGVAVPR